MKFLITLHNQITIDMGDEGTKHTTKLIDEFFIDTKEEGVIDFLEKRFADKDYKEKAIKSVMNAFFAGRESWHGYKANIKMLTESGDIRFLEKDFVVGVICKMGCGGTELDSSFFKVFDFRDKVVSKFLKDKLLSPLLYFKGKEDLDNELIFVVEAINKGKLTSREFDDFIIACSPYDIYAHQKKETKC